MIIDRSNKTDFSSLLPSSVAPSVWTGSINDDREISYYTYLAIIIYVISTSVVLCFPKFKIINKLLKLVGLDTFPSDKDIKGFYGYPLSISYYIILLILSSSCFLILIFTWSIILTTDIRPIVFSLFTILFSNENNWMITLGIYLYWILSFLLMFETYILFKFDKEVDLEHIIDKIGLIIISDLVYHNLRALFMIVPILLSISFHILLAFGFLSHYIFDKLCQHNSIIKWQIRTNLFISIVLSLFYGNVGWYMLIFRLILYISHENKFILKEEGRKEGNEEKHTEIHNV